MANRNSVWDMSTTALSNDNIAGISLQENVTKPSDVNNIMREQEAQAIRFSNDLGGAATTSGTNTITVTLAQTFAAYVVGQRFLVLLGGTNTGACTLNVNGLGAKNIKIKTSGTARDPVSGELVSGNYAEFQYDGTNMNLLSQTALAASTGLSNDPFYNLSLSVTVAANALTIALKGADGNDPSATNPVIVSFRSVTAATGTTSQLTLTAATSFVVSSGSTLGTSNAIAAVLAVVGFNDAGTFRLGIINPYAGNISVAQGIASSTAEGGAGAADSAGVFYTGTAVTSKAYTVLGYLTVTEATAGTWATAPSKIQLSNSYIPLYDEGTWTPVVTSSSGTITTVGSVNGTYVKKGKEVTVIGRVAITTNGSGAGVLVVDGLPYSNASNFAVGCGREVNITGAMQMISISTATRVQIAKYDGTYPASSGSDHWFNYTYFTN